MLNVVKGVSEFHDAEAEYWSESIIEGYLKNQKVSTHMDLVEVLVVKLIIVLHEQPVESTQLRLYDDRAPAMSLEMLELFGEDDISEPSTPTPSTPSSHSAPRTPSTPSGPVYSPVSAIEGMPSSSSSESV